VKGRERYSRLGMERRRAGALLCSTVKEAPESSRMSLKGVGGVRGGGGEGGGSSSHDVVQPPAAK
jgi:hypothetical protein